MTDVEKSPGQVAWEIINNGLRCSYETAVDERDIELYARAAAGTLPPVELIESVSWVAFFSPPKSWSQKRKAAAIGKPHRARPDRDNIDKALLDALFPEDSGIAKGTIEKRWDIAERLEVTIEVSGADYEG